MLSFLLAISDMNDHDKLLYLYNTYHAKLLQYARTLLNHQNRTYNEEDAVQNTYMSVMTYGKSIKCWDNETALYSYLLTSLRHECYAIQKAAVYLEDLDEYRSVLISDDDFVAKINEEADYQDLVQKILQLEDSDVLVLGCGLDRSRNCRAHQYPPQNRLYTTQPWKNSLAETAGKGEIT